MPLTKDFKETIKARAERDPEFRVGLFREAIEAMLSDDLETGILHAAQHNDPGRRIERGVHGIRTFKRVQHNVPDRNKTDQDRHAQSKTQGSGGGCDALAAQQNIGKHKEQ